MRVDTHIHTKDFSGDAIMDFDILVNDAKSNPSEFYCVTEHYDYAYPDIKNQLIFNPDDYYNFYNGKKKEFESTYQSNFPIFYGVEYGYMEDQFNYFNDFALKYNFDCIICSAHYIDGCDPFFNREYYNKGKKHVYEAYFKTMIHALEFCDGFDIIGHFDYLSRYAPYKDKKIYYYDFSDYFDKIFSLCISKGKALELNTRTSAVFRKENISDYFIDNNILKRYKELGGDLITYGSDAHIQDNVFTLYEKTLVDLKSSGFKYITYYKNRRPILIPI